MGVVCLSVRHVCRNVLQCVAVCWISLFNLCHGCALNPDLSDLFHGCAMFPHLHHGCSMFPELCHGCGIFPDLSGQVLERSGKVCIPTSAKKQNKTYLSDAI